MILYSTSGCHLCDDAEALLQARRAAGASLSWRRIDIADDDRLFERYGWSIPVLRADDGRELAWPFDAAALARFLDGRR